MKVCTDACLFGAWAAAHSSQLTAHCSLDIGAGTGLLSLMLVQKVNDAIIDAVEIDEAAAEQSRENFDASKWKDRLNVYHDSVQQFALTATKNYDLIISNPPFYENDLKSDDAKRNITLHSEGLKLEELINITDKLLNDDGNFFVLLPFYRTEYFIQSADKKFFVQAKVCIKQTSEHDYFRSILWLTKQPAETIKNEIVIMGDDAKYSSEFADLLKDYYLRL